MSDLSVSSSAAVTSGSSVEPSKKKMFHELNPHMESSALVVEKHIGPFFLGLYIALNVIFLGIPFAIDYALNGQPAVVNKLKKALEKETDLTKKATIQAKLDIALALLKESTVPSSVSSDDDNGSEVSTAAASRSESLRAEAPTRSNEQVVDGSSNPVKVTPLPPRDEDENNEGGE